MARIVESHMKPILTMVVETILNDGSVSTMKFKEGDTVTNLRYIKDGEIVKVSGRIAKINFKLFPIIRNYTEISKLKSSFASDVIIETVDLDASAVYQSNVIEIPAMEIVENESIGNVKRMNYFLQYGASFEVELSDNTTNKFELYEGQDIIGLTYLDRGDEKTVNARLVAMKYDSNLVPTTLITIINGKIKQIPSIAVKGVTDTIIPISAGDSLANAIKTSVSGVVSVGEGTFNEEIVIEKDTVICGAKAGIPATNFVARTGTDETVISGEIKVAAGTNITLDGVTLSEKALMNMKGVSGIELKNCRVTNLTASAQKTYAILTSADDIVKMVITGCWFGPNPELEDGAKTIYNLIELSGALKDGSEISNNYFAESASTHNDINIYKVVDGAHIVIKNNVWEKSANGIRLGVKEQPTCTVEIENNTYYATDEDPVYAGLLLIQPCGKMTTSMANMTVILNGNVYTNDDGSSQLYYLYAGANDMQFTESNVPTIIVDGDIEMQPVVPTPAV